MDNMICHHINPNTVYPEVSLRYVKIHKSVGKPKLVLPYVSPYLSSIMCGCVQNTAANAVRLAQHAGACQVASHKSEISYSPVHNPCTCFWPSRHNFREVQF